VISAEAVPRAKKLLKLEVDVGERRTIVAGIAGKYDPDDLVGRQVIILANLKPAKLMGIKSNGMALAAVDGEILSLAAPDREMKPGTPLR
jgi:methionyl-tRNA synthetase